MKKVLSVALCLVLLLGTVAVGGEGFSQVIDAVSLKASAETYGVLTYEISDGKVTITHCDKSATGALEIPSEIGGCPVTSIGYRAFDFCDSLTGITIPDSVTSIGNSAFYGCTSLTEITLPYIGLTPNSTEKDAVFGSIFGYFSTYSADTTYQEYDSFKSCYYYIPRSLRKVTVTNTTTIPQRAFNNIYFLTEITFPYSVTRIDNYAFDGCRGLTSINIPDSVTSIGYMAFRGCRGLTSINIPDSVTSIDNGVFSSCTGLTSIVVDGGNTVYHSAGNCLTETESKTLIAGCKNSVIPDDGSVINIGERAFSGCTGLTSVTIPLCVTSIGNSTFSGCTGLTSITIPDSITSIGERAFSGCTGFTSVTIPCSVTSIDNYAFEFCTRLTSITIPDSVTNIGNGVFYGCTGLTDVYYTGTEEEWNAITIIGTNDDLLTATIHYNYVPVPHTVTWNLDGGNINGNTDSVVQNCVYGNVIVPPADPKKEGCTFIGWTPEVASTVPDEDIIYTATWINSVLTYEIINGEVTITHCNESASGALEIPSEIYGCPVTSIGFHAFEYCGGLTGITIPDSVTSIGVGAFLGCDGLTSITIPDSVTNIGFGVFVLCKLTSIKVDEGNTVYHSAGNCLIETESKALIAGCKNSVIPDDGSVTSIGGYAFNGCFGLTSITIPDSVTDIGRRSFDLCVSLTSIEVDEGNTVYHSAGNCLIETESKTLIAGCKNSVIPDDGSVTSIGDYAFYGCIGLKSIIIPDSITSIGEEAFYLCKQGFIGETGLTDVYYTGTEEEWNAIAIDEGNDDLLTATIHYNYVSAPHTVIWNLDGGNINGNTESVVQNCVYGDEIVKPDDPTKEGYEFLGWSEDGETVVEVEETVQDRDIEYIAVWSIKQYSIIFKYGEVKNNAVYKTITADFGTEIEEVADPGFDGYTFLNWDSQIPETMPAKDTTITALWAVKEYTVTYKLDGAEYFATPYESAVDTVVYGATVPVRGKAVKEGYTVSDWKFTPALKNGKMPAGNVVANATSSINSYTLTVNYEMSNGKNELAPETHTEQVEFGAQYSVTSPNVDGYTPNKAKVEGTMGAGEVNVTVTYSPNPHTVTWNLDGGNINGYTNSVVQNYVYGDVIIPPANPEKEGCTFTGWTPKVAATVPDADIIYTATYINNIQTDSVLTYEIIDGEVTITDCDESAAGALEIPSEIGGYPVTSIGSQAFSDCAGLTSVTIPDSVTSIGNSVFSGCTSLTDVYYNSTEADWNAITIGKENDDLLNATVHFNYNPNFDLVQAKESAKAEIDTLANGKSDEVKALAETAKKNIDAATRIDEVNAAKQNGIDAINAQIKKENDDAAARDAEQAAKALADAKEAAKAEIDKVVPADASDAVKALAETAKKNIDAATRIDEVNAAKKNGIDAINAQLASEKAAAPVIDGFGIVNGSKGTLNADYKSTVIFHTTAKAPDGYKIVWSNGQEGDECKFTATKSEYKISAKLVNISTGETVQTTEEVTVKVSATFIAKIIAFFKGLFNMLPTYEDFKKQ